jgi:iron complex transport system ATP-binding protein
MIEIKNVSKRYGEKIVVSEVQLPITEQKLTAFIGPNGAGKSTLLIDDESFDSQRHRRDLSGS